MVLCEIYNDVKCLGVDDCLVGGECEELECDGVSCENYDNGCAFGITACKKEKI